MQKRRKKSPTKKSINKELGFIAKLYERKSDTCKMLNSLQQSSSLEKIAKDSQEPYEFEPLPKGVQQTLEKHSSMLKREQQNFSKENFAYKHNIDFKRRLATLEEYSRIASIIGSDQCADETTQLGLSSGQFINPVNEGAASANRGNFLNIGSDKMAYSEVGYADLTGSGAQAWNRNVFGFVSTFTLPGPGRQNTVTIYSHMHSNFVWPDGWLEALSFGRLAWGEVKVNSHLDVLVGGNAYRDGVDTLLHGISPRGHYREGEIGIYHPTAETRDVDHEITFTVTNPANGQLQVSIFELAEFIAERHHRVDRCNAAVWGTCTWSLTDVSIITRC